MSDLPDRYRKMGREDLRERIRAQKERYGKELVILGHHYQRQDIIDFADFRGDSLGLSRLASGQTACRFIVFCGVNFMAESAEILRKDHQVVQHPHPGAGCPLADMADEVAAEIAWEDVSAAADEGAVIPITYMNSDAELKAFCGRNGGLVCTSSNAPKAFRWAMKRGAKIIFFPDEHLGRNTAREVGIAEEEILLWDPAEHGRKGRRSDDIQRARLFLWKGFCHVHTHFLADHVRKAREETPGAKIVVHPECRSEVVLSADAAGSTEYICRYVEEAPGGTTIYVGTEVNLVDRLAREHPEKNVRVLSRSMCPNMARIDLAHLLWTLDGIGDVNRVHVDAQVKADARLALERMLQV